jgi:eukaryotic-like serine/threonine-protein kinase
MQCPLCQADNPPTAISCGKCSTPLPLDDRTLGATVTGGTAPPSATPRGTSAWSVAVTPQPDAPYAQGEALVGTLLAERYEILELLGQGGMGAVYKAHDTELERLVALKLIRPDLASNPEILRRFKQELILAREVTHRNVIRIFDLGQTKGFKFITMEFVEGRDLRAILQERGKLPPEEAVRIISQVCRALESAHAAGVVHRDLKPQNIMLDAKDRVYVMDFGIAHSLETPGMTQTGALMGTPEYMSPEQAKGIKVDPRSDLFSLGIIFYELLTGISPFKADTALATLLKRTQERPQPPAEVDPTIPKAISDVVMKCLEIDRDQRFSTAREILEDLGQEVPTSVRTVAPKLPPVIPTPQAKEISPFVRYRTWIAGVAAVVLLAAIGIAFRGKIFSGLTAKRAAPVEQASLAILPFRNASGDKSLDWLGPSLADMLSTDVGQSSHLRTVSSDRLHQILHDLQISPDATSDATNVRRVTSLANVDTVVSGQFAKFGDQIRIDATLRDLKRDRSVTFKAEASGEKDLLPAVDRLAQTIRDNLSLQRNVLDELKAQSFKPSSKSVDAIRLYSEGTDLARQGKNLEALKRFQASIQADPEFALAYAKLGQTYGNLGHDTEAEQFSRKAVDLAENLPAREKYLITANYARIERDYPKAIGYYENLATTSPDDPEIQLALAGLYEDTGVVDKARVHYSKVLSGDPKNVDALLASGRLEIQSGNPQGALDFFNRALTLSIQLGNDEAKSTILQGMGVAYDQLNKPDDAVRNFQQALEIRRRLGDKRGVAVSLNALAEIQGQLGRSDQALKGYQEALQIRREIGDKPGLGDTLLDLGGFYNERGHYDQALELFKEALQVQRDLGSESNQGLCLNNIGLTYLSKGDYENALTYFQQALDLRQRSQVPEDTAFALHNLAVTSEKMGHYDKALSYYMRALDIYRNTGDKRSAAMASYGMGVLFGYQGRLGAAMNAKQEALKNFTELQDRTYWMTEVLSGYGIALADAGRLDDAKKPLDEALALARELKIDGSISQALDYQGECFFYRSDFKSSRSLYDQALQFASRSKEQEKILLSKVHIAQAMLKQGRAPEAAIALRNLAGQADRLGMKYLGLEASVYLGEALVESKEYEGARQELERASAGAEKLELRGVLAQAHYSLATALRLSGHGAEATAHYRKALQYLDEIRKDTGSDAVLQRSDLNTIYAESSRWVKS